MSSNNNSFHPYGRTSVRRQASSNSLFPPPSSSSSSTSAATNPFQSSISSRAGLSNSIGNYQGRGQQDDILGEFNLYIQQKELLRSQSARDKGRESINSNASSFRRSTNSNATCTSNTSSVDMFADPELVKARREIRELKEQRRKVLDGKASMDRRLLDLETSNQEKESKVTNLLAKTESLEADRELLIKRNKELEERLGEVEEELIGQKEETNSTIQNLKYHIEGLEEDLSTVTGQSERTRRHLEQRLELMISERDSLETQVDQCQDELERQADLVIRGREMYSNLERRCAKAEALVAQNEISGGATEELNIIKRTLDEQTRLNQAKESRIIELNDQIRYLRGMQENTERLKEEKLALSQRLSRMSQVQERADALDLEVAHLKAEKARWAKFLEDHDDTGIDSPYALSRMLAELRLENVRLREKLGQGDSERLGFKLTITRLEKEVTEWQVRARDLEAKREAEVRNLHRVERSRALSQETIDMLRSQLDSYAAEEEHMLTGNYDKQKAQQIAQLEQMVKQYQDHVHTLEKELKNAPALPTPASAAGQPPSAGLSDKIRKLEDIIANLNKEKIMLEKENASLDTQLGELQQALGRGAFDSSRTRVLQLADNPESRELAIRQSTLDALREENKKLLEQMAQLGSGQHRAATAQAGLVPVESLRATQEDCTRLQALVEEKEKRVLRLTEIYGKKAQEYREAVFSLLGYQLNIEIDGRVRLSSMYATDQDPSLLFTSREADQGTMQLVGGSEDAQGRVRAAAHYYVEQMGSVPALLAGITLECFERGARV
ncbi:mitotic checkpoint protein-domain-containing protein [Phlyctochytrium arcticum]|nr:mitotic checkpoint protein-domain-containing protein [Phlyctochytrium arcticum]